MVGGLADWFAVVALFRHPLGVPIPHTAIITERKEQFGETLGEFIQSSFLTGDAVAERVRAANVGDRDRPLAGRSGQRRPAGRPRARAARSRWSTSSRTRTCTTSLERLVRERLEAASIVPDGRTGPRQRSPSDGRHDEVVDAALQGLNRYLDEHRDELHERFRDQAPWWLPGAVEDRIFVRLLDGARAVLDDMVNDREHGLRRQLDEQILQSGRRAADLARAAAPRASSSPATCSSAPSCARGSPRRGPTPRRSCAPSPPIPESALRQQVAAAITAGGERLLAEPALVAKIDDAAEAARALRGGALRR